MKNFNFNEIIEYIDSTRDLNFEAAQRWAQEHGTTFVEDVAKREPYEQEHEETYMSPEGGMETRIVKTPTIKRFFVIGDESKLHVPTEDELKAQVRAVRDKYMQTTQNRIDRYRNQKELGIVTTDSEATFNLLLQYTQYLRDYPNGEKWWVKNPMVFDEYSYGKKDNANL